jgi:hypothetical protein
MKILNAFMLEVLKDNRDICQIPDNELNTIICKYIINVRQSDGCLVCLKYSLSLSLVGPGIMSAWRHSVSGYWACCSSSCKTWAITKSKIIEIYARSQIMNLIP